MHDFNSCHFCELRSRPFSKAMLLQMKLKCSGLKAGLSVLRTLQILPFRLLKIKVVQSSVGLFSHRCLIKPI
jgi:hypothetical protein